MRRNRPLGKELSIEGQRWDQRNWARGLKELTRATVAVANKMTFLGTGAGAGADEDDFHTFKRKSAQVDKEQKAVDKIQKSKLKSQAQLPKQKVVIF